MCHEKAVGKDSGIRRKKGAGSGRRGIEKGGEGGEILHLNRTKRNYGTIKLPAVGSRGKSVG
jgi:hypothetical protein